jgi:hypothetical protein
LGVKKILSYQIPRIKPTFNKLKNKVMGKGQDSKKAVKKEAAKTPKEKKEAKRLKKGK